LLAVNMAVAAAGAMVVIVQGEVGLNQRATALTLAAFGGGSMCHLAHENDELVISKG
jgi:hypothetical protein